MAKIVGIDTCVFIYLLEDHPTYAKKAQRVLRSVESGRREGVFSVLGMVELLTGPKKLGRDDIAVQYEQLIHGIPHLSVRTLNERIVWIASDLRAKYGIRTPDAVHLATALDAGASSFVTNDKHVAQVKELEIVLL